MEDHEYGYKLAFALSSLSENLSKCEITKKILIEQRDFDVYGFYRYLDNFSCEGITAMEILRFCQEQDFVCSEVEAKMMVKWWDLDCDGHVSLDDFLSSISPDGYRVSRRYKHEIQPKYAGKYGFVRFIHRELNLLSDLQNNRNCLYGIPGYSPERSFFMISDKPTITPTQIFEFVDKYRVPALISDINLIFKKFDRQKSGNLTYLEFCDILGTGQPSFSQSFTVRATPTSSPRYTWNDQAINKTNTPRTFSPPNKNTQIINNLEKLLLKYSEISTNLESLQKKLALEWDFTVSKCFKLFDLNFNGFLTTRDLTQGLISLGLTPTPKEIFLLFRRFDNDCDGKLSVSEFSEIIFSQDKHYQNLVESREETDLGLGSVEALAAFFQYLLSSEEIIEDCRLQFSESTDLYEAFSVLDSDQDGVLNFPDIKLFFSRTLNDSQIRHLLKTFDKNRDGLISFTEFMQELTPQCPETLQIIN